MNKKKQITLIHERYMASENEAEKEVLMNDLNELIGDDDELYRYAAEDTLNVARMLNVSVALESVLPMLNCAFISKTYFNKTRPWFYQRLNGNVVGGKRVHFSLEEIEKLRSALRDISSQISLVADKL